jgi:hypothetical protein
MFMKYANRIMVLSLTDTGSKYLCLSLLYSPQFFTVRVCSFAGLRSYLPCPPTVILTRRRTSGLWAAFFLHSCTSSRLLTGPFINTVPTSVADPDPRSGGFCPLDSGWVKNQAGSGINISGHFSESLETIVVLKIYLNSLMRIRIWDPESF